MNYNGWTALKMARAKASTVAGVASISIQIPGTAGKKERFISGGSGWFITSSHPDDYAKIHVVDDDNILGLGAGAVVGSYCDEDLASDNHGWYFCDGKIEISTIDRPALLLAGLYLKIIATTGDLRADTFYCNIKWGVP